MKYVSDIQTVTSPRLDRWNNRILECVIHSAFCFFTSKHKIKMEKKQGGMGKIGCLVCEEDCYFVNVLHVWKKICIQSLHVYGTVCILVLIQTHWSLITIYICLYCICYNLHWATFCGCKCWTVNFWKIFFFIMYNCLCKV